MAPIPLLLQGKFHTEIPTGLPERGVKQGRDGENKPFLPLNVNISKTIGGCLLYTSDAADE